MFEQLKMDGIGINPTIIGSLTGEVVSPPFDVIGELAFVFFFVFSSYLFALFILYMSTGSLFICCAQGFCGVA